MTLTEFIFFMGCYEVLKFLIGFVFVMFMDTYR